MSDNKTTIWAKNHNYLLMAWNKLYKNKGYKIERSIDRKFRLRKLWWWYSMTISIDDVSDEFKEFKYAIAPNYRDVVASIMNSIEASNSNEVRIIVSDSDIYKNFFEYCFDDRYKTKSISIRLSNDCEDGIISVKYFN